MGHDIKFPTECFSDMHDNTPLRDKIAERVKTHGIEERQPNLFSRGTWRELFVIDDDVSTGTIIGASLMTAWGFTKRSYQCDPSLIEQITTTELGPVGQCTDALFNFEGCSYFEGRGCWLSALDVQGYWMSVQNNGDGSGSILWLLNTATAMIPVELPFDDRGMWEALSDYQKGAEDFAINELGLGGKGHYSDPGMYWIGSIISELKLMYYLLSTNAEIRRAGPTQASGYQLNDKGELIVPAKLSQLVVGESIGAKIKATSTLKNAHWIMHDDGSFTWLCGADSQGIDYRDATYCTGSQTDEELVSLNEGRTEDRFTAILTKEESKACDNGLAHNELKSRVAERIHQARRRVAEKNGQTYDRIEANRAAEAKRQKQVSGPLSEMAEKALAQSDKNRRARSEREASTCEIEPRLMRH